MQLCSFVSGKVDLKSTCCCSTGTLEVQQSVHCMAPNQAQASRSLGTARSGVMKVNAKLMSLFSHPGYTGHYTSPAVRARSRHLVSRSPSLARPQALYLLLCVPLACPFAPPSYPNRMMT